MIEIKNISKTFGGNKALSNVTLKIEGGMNFIVGASGSGKTTLLRIISGMDTQFDGDVLYNKVSIKNLSHEEKALNNGCRFGFISQSFHLLDEMTVRENILLPTYLKEEDHTLQFNSLLKTLKIDKIADQKINTLSGGQKQRVAIARELMKNPSILIADEPTAALDDKVAKEIIAILYEISKKKTVIVVTHDTFLIQGSASVYEFDKGELIASAVKGAKNKNNTFYEKPLRLSGKKALELAAINFKRHSVQTGSMIMAFVVAVTCLCINLNGTFSNQSNQTFEALSEKQGSSILNLNLVSTFTSAGMIDSEYELKGEVTQDISGLMEKYQNDSRVETIIITAPLSDAVIQIDGKDFIIEESGQAPIFNKMVAGTTADNSKSEVVLPKVLVDKLGYAYDEIVGKEASFYALVYNWENQYPIEKEVFFKAIISGVADTEAVLELEGEEYSFEYEDSLFLSGAVVNDINKQAQREDGNTAFSIQAKTPEDFVSLYDEIMAMGIVPLGQIELIRDILSLKGATGSQTEVAYMVIAVLSFLAIVSISSIIGFMRKKQYAIYKQNGFTKANIAKVIALEHIFNFVISLFVSTFICLAMNISLVLCSLIAVSIFAVCYGINTLIAIYTNEIIALKTGDR